MSRRQLVPSLLVLLVAALVAAPAAAGAWRPVTQSEGTNTDDIASLRASDGSLHVGYLHLEDTSAQYLRHRVLSANGLTWSAPVNVVGPWNDLSSPDLEVVGSTLHAFWGGIGSTDPADSTRSGQAWYATFDQATGWTRSTTPLSVNDYAYSALHVSSALDSNGTPLVAWAGAAGMRVHAGLAQGTTDEPNLAPAGCCPYAVNVERDRASGDVHLLYYSNEDGNVGVFSRRVAPTLGDAVRLPIAVGQESVLSRGHRLAAAPRTTGGVYTAACDTYPSCRAVRVVGTSGPTLRLATAPGTNAEKVWVAAAPQGRMWLAWGDNDNRLWAVRSNRALTRWGAVRRLTTPPATTSTWALAGDGSTGPLDLLVNASAQGGLRVWHERVLPQLQLQVVKVTTQRNGARVVTLRAHDAGDSTNAAVTYRGTTKQAGLTGLVSFTVPRGTVGATRATATRAGYVAGGVTVRLR